MVASRRLLTESFSSPLFLFYLMEPAGFEPTTDDLQYRYSSVELRPHNFFIFFWLVRGEGIDPPPVESQPTMLPLHQPLLFGISHYVTVLRELNNSIRFLYVT